MRDLATIQGESRQHAINEKIEDIFEALVDLTVKGSWPLDDTRAADEAIVNDGDELSNAERQKNNAALYRALVELIGKAKANGWPQEQLQKADLLVTSIERAATGRTLENGVPAGFKFAA